MKILNDIIKYIDNNSSIAITDIDTFYTESSTSVMLQQTPSSSAETRYFDGSRAGEYGFDIYVKSLNSFECIEKLSELEALLDIPNGLSLDSFDLLKCVTISTGVLVQKTKKNEKIYSSSFKLDYYSEK